MRVFICRDNVDSCLTGIFDAWTMAITIGHENVRLIRDMHYEPTLFDECVQVESDYEKAAKVTRSIRNKISWQAYELVYFAMLSHETSAIDDAYRFLNIGFKAGADIVNNYTNPCVLRMHEIKRNVGNEACSFREFLRFEACGQAYIGHIEPKSNVALLVGEHFADRMPSEHWMIIDDRRRIAVVHPKDGDNYLRELTVDEAEQLNKTKSVRDEYSHMWKTFFDAIAIQQKINPTCQMNHFPLWKRKNVVEFEKKM